MNPQNQMLLTKERRAAQVFIDLLKKLEEGMIDYRTALRRAANQCIVCGSPAEECLYDYCQSCYEKTLIAKVSVITQEDRDDHCQGDCLGGERDA